MAALTWSPQTIEDTVVDLRLSTRAGIEVSMWEMTPRPSCPCMLLPHEYTWP
jgi:hypothetical protein